MLNNDVRLGATISAASFNNRELTLSKPTALLGLSSFIIFITDSQLIALKSKMLEALFTPLVVRVFLVVNFSASFMPIVAKNLLNIEDIDVGLACVIPSDIKLVTLSLRSVSRSHVSKKKIQSCLTEPIEHTQQYRYCN